MTELKSILQKFLDCKDVTEKIAKKSLELKSEEAFLHVISEQKKCLETINQLKAQSHPSLNKYMDGIDASEARIAAEKKFLENVLSGNTETLSTSMLGIGLVSHREKALWTAIEQNVEETPYWTFQWAGGTMITGWALFITIALLLIFKGRIGVNSESVRLYFDTQRDKFFKFLLKILNSDKK